MSFIEDIRNMQNERVNKEELVINEIIKYFEERFDKENYENYLKGRIKDRINESKNTLILYTEFWNYHCGCSNTNFSSGGVVFELENGKNEYKGIELCNIQYKVGEKLSQLLRYKLESLGLQVVSSCRLDDQSRFKYYKEKIVIKWN